MSRRNSTSRRGITLIEILVVIAIIAVLIGIFLPAVQRARDSANRTRCQSNLRQVALALFSFHDQWGTFPPYNGSMQLAEVPVNFQVPGSWIVFLLPFLDQDSMWANISSDVATYGNGTNSVPSVLSPSYVAALATWNADLASGQITATTTSYTVNYPATPPTPPTPPQTIDQNGYTITIPGSPGSPGSPAGSYQASTTTYTNASGQTVSPPSPTYTQPGGYVGVYSTAARGLVQKVLQCPSDPSLGLGGQSNNKGQVYLNNGVWGSTNYLANWNTITTGDGGAGYAAPPSNLESIMDGPSNTILLAEAYAWCDGIGRTAEFAWQNNVICKGTDYTTGTNVYGVHNFGLTYTISGAATVQTTGADGSNISIPGAPNGYPNPTLDGLNFMFQVQPSPLPSPCPAGKICCNNLTVQGGHFRVMNIAMADGSVRGVSPSMSTTTWLHAMHPNDSQPLGSDWNN